MSHVTDTEIIPIDKCNRCGIKAPENETLVEEFQRQHPWLWWREWNKFRFTEWLARWFNIHVDW